MIRTPPSSTLSDTPFPYHTLFSSWLAMLGYISFVPTGLYAWGDYRQSVENKRVVLSKLTKRENELQNRVNLLDRRRVDPDLADEYVREKLGVMHPDEIAIPMDEKE